jgi:hypothetical protein
MATVRRSPSILAALAAAAALAGCGSSEPPETPSACRAPASAYLSALEAAPGDVRLEGTTPISGCLVEEQEAGALAEVGKAMVAAATELNRRVLHGASRQTAVELGYLVGAVEARASQTGGIHHDLELRIESAARYAGPQGDSLPPGFEAAFDEGQAAATR